MTPRAVAGHTDTARGTRRGGRGRPGAIAGIDWPGTLRARRDAALRPEHLRRRRQAAAGGALHCLLLDCSGSMLRRQQLALAKGLLLHWSAQLYRQRAELAVIGFGGGGARLLQAPRKAVAFNEQWLAAIDGGGATPVADALAQARRLLAQARRAQPGRRLGLWLLTDGRFAERPACPPQADFCVVVDFEQAALPLGRAQRLAHQWHADYVSARALVSINS